MDSFYSGSVRERSTLVTLVLLVTLSAFSEEA